MKKILFILLTGLLLSFTLQAQIYSVNVNGTVMMMQGNAVTPVPNQEVIITIDSTGNGFSYQNSVYTDEAGYYEDFVEIPGFNGYGYVNTSTYDSCLGYYQYNYQSITPGGTLLPMDFFLCNYVYPECQAQFYYYQADPTIPNTIQFINTSYGDYTSVTWSFGDSTFSDEFDPIHTFPGEGTYYVCLTITDGEDCSSTYCEFVYVGPGSFGCENSFFYYNDFTDPYTVTFEGFMLNNQPAYYYSWDFGDGTYGQGQTVTHTYQPQGIAMYLVGLTTIVMDSTGDSCFYTSYQEVWIDNSGGSDCESFIMPISMYDLTVEFQGYTVSQYATDYTWEFGDGTTGTGEFVTHTYPSPGMYTVYLNTADANGCTYQTFTQIWLDSLNQSDCGSYFTWEQYDTTTFTFYGYVYLNNGMPYPDSSSVYTWDFGDGTTGTGQTVTHYFQDNPVGGYTVCLTASTVLPDGSICESVYCEYIVTSLPSFNIFGSVYLENNLLADQGLVHLMTMDTLWQGVVEVQTVTLDSGGFYSFNNIPMYNTRLYFVQAELTEGSAYYGDYMPTYHLNAMSWEQAMPILPLNNWPADVYMIPGSPLESGSGTITGIVTNLGARSNMSGVEVVLMDGQSNPIRYTRSDDMGIFSFENLPFNTYVIHAEMMGIHTMQATITLTEQDPVESVEVQVSGSEANFVFGVPEQQVILDKVGDIFPNPVSETSKIEITAKKPVALLLRVFSQTGQLMQEESFQVSSGTVDLEFETNSLPSGLYLLRITTSQGETVSRKFLKVQ